MVQAQAKEKERPLSESLLKVQELRGFLLAEVAVQQTLERLAVTGFVAGHLVDGVVDGIQAQGLGLLGQLGLRYHGLIPCNGRGRLTFANIVMVNDGYVKRYF